MTQRLYLKLIVWQQAHALCLEAYNKTKDFPSHERFRLIDQLCRSASSVPANIAEGNTKPSSKEKARYIDIAQGSLDESHYHWLLARDLGYISAEYFSEIDKKVSSIGYLLSQLQKNI